jgi:hypothetical protein
VIAIALILLLAGRNGDVAAQNGGKGSAAQWTRGRVARGVMQKFSECVVERVRPAKLDGFLRIPPGSWRLKEAIPQIATDNCAPDRINSYSMTFKYDVMRAGLYDALYRIRFRYGPADISGVAPLDFRAEFDQDPVPLPAETIYLRQIGDCTVRKDSAAARALLMTRQGGEQEMAAIGPIKALLASCVPSGSKIVFSAPLLRGTVAEALYKLSLAAGGSALGARKEPS